MKTKYLLTIILSLTAILQAQVTIPIGWMRPHDSLFIHEWRNKSELKYLALGADFDCNGKIDSAFILESKNGNGIGLFVFLKSENKYKEINLYNSLKDKRNYENLNSTQKEQIKKQLKSAYGINDVKPGIYKTACGKGYWDCDKEETEDVLLKCVGIDYFLTDSYSSYYYWDNVSKKFKYIRISD